MRVVPGVELSAVEGDVETHILGLHLCDTREMESRLVASARDASHARRANRRSACNELGVRIEFDACSTQAAGGAIGRPHVARAMIAEGWAVDFRDAFERYLGNGRPAYVGKERLAMRRRDRAHSSRRRPGGAGASRRTAARASASRRSSQHGIDGVEVRHPSHSPRTSHASWRSSSIFSLVPSGGSDWHGATDGPRTLGHDARARSSGSARQDRARRGAPRVCAPPEGGHGAPRTGSRWSPARVIALDGHRARARRARHARRRCTTTARATVPTKRFG